MTRAEVPVETGTPRAAFAWAITTTLSSSNPAVLALASSAVTIPTIVPPTKIRKAVLWSFPETITTATKLGNGFVKMKLKLVVRTLFPCGLLSLDDFSSRRW